MINNTEKIKYSIIICVNNQALLSQFIETIGKISNVYYEIIPIDNYEGRYSLPQALNIGMSRAKGDVCLFCHQDIRFPTSWLDKLTQQIEILNEKDPRWGVVGIMGVTIHGFFAGNIIDPHTNTRMGNLPCEVVSLDEVCLIMKKDSTIHFDELLGGFHLYGADICLQAQQSNLKCYAIDAPFEHVSGGRLDDAFWVVAKKLKKKWSQIKDSPYTIETTCGVFQLSDGIRASLSFCYKGIRRKIIRRIQGRHRKAF
jgi:glycosyltransferase involved in cell wall biosynthesis